MRKILWAALTVVLPTLLLCGCSLLGEQSTDGMVVSTIPVIDPSVVESGLGRCRDMPAYQVGGRVFNVLPSVAGYRERGLAVSYNSKQSQRLTSSCERLDEHIYSAAHRTLPLLSYVRVTNLTNGRSIIVRINDRGPFDERFLLQLSPASVRVLGMQQGATQMQIDGVSDQQAADPARMPAVGLSNTNKSALAEVKTAVQGNAFYIIVGSYPTQEEAEDTFIRLTSVGLGKSEMATAVVGGQEMHQVRIGPLYDQNAIDNVKNVLESNGLATFRVVGIRG